MIQSDVLSDVRPEKITAATEADELFDFLTEYFTDPDMIDEAVCAYVQTSHDIVRGNGEFAWRLPETEFDSNVAGLSRYVHRGINGNYDSALAEHYDARDSRSIKRTHRRTFIDAAQGTVVHVAAEVVQEPVIVASISTCSVLVGRREGELLVAHISYSEQSKVAEIITAFLEQGVSPEEIYGVVSVGSPEENQYFEPKPDDIDFYTGMGIPSRNLQAFRHQTIGPNPTELIRSSGEPQLRHENVHMVTVTKDGIAYVASDVEVLAGGFGGGRSQVTNMRNPGIIEFAPNGSA